MQAPSAQLRRDVCGSFDGLSLHADHMPNTSEDAEDPSVPLDLRELGLLPDKPASSLLYSTDSQQTPQQQDETLLAQEVSSWNPDNVSKQQQHSSPQLNNKPETGVSSPEGCTAAAEGMKHKAAAHHVAHPAAADAEHETVTLITAPAGLQCWPTPALAQAQQRQVQPPSSPEAITQANDGAGQSQTKQQNLGRSQAAPAAAVQVEPVKYPAVRQQTKFADPVAAMQATTGGYGL